MKIKDERTGNSDEKWQLGDIIANGECIGMIILDHSGEFEIMPIGPEEIFKCFDSSYPMFEPDAGDDMEYFQKNILVGIN